MLAERFSSHPGYYVVAENKPSLLPGKVSCIIASEEQTIKDICYHHVTVYIPQRYDTP